MKLRKWRRAIYLHGLRYTSSSEFKTTEEEERGSEGQRGIARPAIAYRDGATMNVLGAVAKGLGDVVLGSGPEDEVTEAIEALLERVATAFIPEDRVLAIAKLKVSSLSLSRSLACSLASRPPLADPPPSLSIVGAREAAIGPCGRHRKRLVVPSLPHRWCSDPRRLLRVFPSSSPPPQPPINELTDHPNRLTSPRARRSL